VTNAELIARFTEYLSVEKGLARNTSRVITALVAERGEQDYCEEIPTTTKRPTKRSIRVMALILVRATRAFYQALCRCQAGR
jgi:hypothetical protein